MTSRRATAKIQSSWTRCFRSFTETWTLIWLFPPGPVKDKCRWLDVGFTMCLAPNLQLPEPDQRLIQLFWWEFICSVAFVPNVLQCNPLHLSTLLCCQIETYRDRGFTWSLYLQNIVYNTWFLIISGHPWTSDVSYVSHSRQVAIKADIFTGVK